MCLLYLEHDVSVLVSKLILSLSHYCASAHFDGFQLYIVLYTRCSLALLTWFTAAGVYVFALMPVLLQLVVTAAAHYPLQRGVVFHILRLLMDAVSSDSHASSSSTAEDGDMPVEVVSRTMDVQKNRRDILEAMIFLTTIGYFEQPLAYMMEKFDSFDAVSVNLEVY
jgi:hypothetical protein